MTAASQNGLVLEFAAEEMKSDFEIVMTAVSQHGLALQYATNEMRGDAKIVETALANRRGESLS